MCMIPFIGNSGKGKTTQTENTLVVFRVWVSQTWSPQIWGGDSHIVHFGWMLVCIFQNWQN
jgi:hypothetical protein